MVAIRDRCAGIAQYGLEKHTVLIDGLIMRTAAPPRDMQDRLRPLLWNQHYRHWGFTILVMCDLRGYAVWTSAALMSDEQTAAKGAGVVLWQRDVRADFGTDVGYLSDSLYSFNLKGDARARRVLHMYSMGPATLKAAKQLAFDASGRVPAAIQAQARQALFTSRYVSQLRAVVENRNRLMRTWGVLGAGAVFRGRLFSARGVGRYMPAPTMIVECVAFLLNRRMHLGEPLRAPDWRPRALLVGNEPPPRDFVCGYPDFNVDEEIVNRGQLQYRIPNLRNKLLGEPKRKKRRIDDEDDEDDGRDDDDYGVIEERGDYVYDVAKSDKPVELNARQQAVLEKRGKRPERFAVADDALARAEALRHAK